MSERSEDRSDSQRGRPRRKRGRGRGPVKRTADAPARPTEDTPSKGSNAARDKRNRKRAGNRKTRQRPKPPEREQAPGRNDAAGFWGEPELLPAMERDVRLTDDAAAIPRSLGPPPLPGHEQVAEHYFTVVYERAVGTAGALAAAGGLIDLSAMVDED